MRVHDLLFQQILLVEEQYDGRVLKPRIGDDGAEERLALLHAVLVVGLDEHLVELAESGQEHDGRDVLEAVYPLASLGALAAHVHHAERDILQHEWIFDDARRGHAHSQHVLLGRQIVLGRYPIQAIQVAVANTHTFKILVQYSYMDLVLDEQLLFGRVGELILAASIVALFDTGIRPQALDADHVRLLERRGRLEVYRSYDLGIFLFAFFV